MSKSSKSCSYTGHMKTMNRVNEAKINYSVNSSQSHQAHPQIEQKHMKKTIGQIEFQLLFYFLFF